MAKQPLEPLIPVEDFKKVVAALARVPKDAVAKHKEFPAKEAKATRKTAPP